MVPLSPTLPIFKALQGHDPKHTAIVDSASGRHVAYAGLLQDVAHAKQNLGHLLKDITDSTPVVSFLLSGGYNYVSE
jgi:hypothetical protein